MVVETLYAPARDGRVAYQAFGRGAMDILVVKHYAFPVDLLWDEPGVVRLLDRVGSLGRGIVFDPRGTGASDPIEHLGSRLIESWVDDAISVLDELGRDRVSVLGFATLPALLFAATHPERVDALVLVHPVARVRHAPDYPIGALEHELEEFLNEMPEVWGSGRFATTFAPSRRADEGFVRWAARCERLAMAPSEGGWRVHANLEADVREVLSAIRVPTLVISGPDDRQSRYVADHITGASLVEVPSKDPFPIGQDSAPVLDATEEFLTGALPTHAVDRMLATVMFTDVVRSTESLVEVGDRRWRALLEAHDHLVRAELARFGGREVKATGDGFLATFDGPGRSIRCGTAIRDQLQSLGMDVRIGLHTGEIERHGDDIAGIAVHTAQRIQATAQPGEVLVSRTIVDLVAGSGLEFSDRGSHNLKGVPGEWTLYATSF